MMKYSADMKHTKYSMKEFLLGFAAGLTAMFIAAAAFPKFLDGINPGSELLTGNHSFGAIAILAVLILLFCIPSALAGILITRLAKTRRSLIAGYVCIALGVFWLVHLYVLGDDIASIGKVGSYKIDSGRSVLDFFINLEYALLLNTPKWIGCVIPLLPVILGIAGALFVNCFEYINNSSRKVKRNT